MTKIDYVNSQEKIFSIYGKTIYIAQKFESTCKEILRWFQLVNIIKEKESTIDFNDFNSYSEKLSKLLLGSSINSFERIRDRINISDKSLKILKEAKLSRNWIAHELCTDNISDYFIKTDLKLKIPVELKHNVINLIKGDYLVSKWSYEFHEKEALYFYDEDFHVDKILNWLEL